VRRLIKKLLMTGIWVVPLTVLIVSMAIYFYETRLLRDQMVWTGMWFGAVLLWLLIWMDQLGRPQEETALQGKKKAMYPPIAPELLYDKPIGLVYGKDPDTKKYVCMETDNGKIMHTFCIGSTGSGKTSGLILSGILDILYPDGDKDLSNEKGCTKSKGQLLALDIKSELHKKGSMIGDARVLVFNPCTRTEAGFDPLYKLNEQSDSQEIFEAMQQIAFSLIPLSANAKDSFWEISAQNLFCSLAIYHYKQGIHNLPDIVAAILKKSFQESIEEVINTSDNDSTEYTLAIPFKDMAEETLGSISCELSNNIQMIMNDTNLRYAMRDNPIKVTPKHLSEMDYSIFFAIPEYKLKAMSKVIDLFFRLMLLELMELPQDGHKDITVILDEFARILTDSAGSGGSLKSIICESILTSRSLGIRYIIITQSTDSLIGPMTIEEVNSLISNCDFKLILSASTRKTQDEIIAWCGKYMARKQSWNGEGKNRKSTVSYEEKNIVDPADLMKLQRTGEAILITPYGYCRVKKVPYYKDNYLKKIAKAVREHNEALTQEEKGD